MFDVNEIRKDFPILDQTVHKKPLVYLDSAATAQKPLCVTRKIEWLHNRLNANVHRGIHYLSEQTTAEYEAARGTMRAFIGAQSTDEIVFTSGATASINLVGYSFGEMCIGRGDNVIVTEMEHHSNIVPWQIVCERKGAELRVLPFDDDGILDTGKLSELLDDRTRIVAVTGASNVLGTRPDLKKIIDSAHRAGAAVIVDGCQSVVHGTVDVKELDCDFYVFSGHKLYGPTGIGVLYGKRRWLEKMPPFMGGGDMVATVSFEKTTYADLPLKFEAGTSNYIGAIALAESVRYLENIGMESIARYEDTLLQYAEHGLGEFPGLRIYGNTPHKAPVISFTIDGTHPYDVGMILDKLGVAIRTGTHCAEPVMAHYGITGMCRASFALYNTPGEVDIFLDALRTAARMLR